MPSEPRTPSVSMHSIDNPNPPAPKLLRAAVLLTRASARLGEAAAAIEQAHEDIKAASSTVQPGDLWTHNSLRAEVLHSLLQAKQETRNMERFAKLAQSLVKPVPVAGGEGGGR